MEDILQLRLIPTLPLFCLLIASVSAQTSAELRQKYGEPTDGRYLVRPHMTAFQFYSEQLHACVIEIRSIFQPTGLDESGELLAPELSEAVIDELAPLEKRGKYSGTYDAEWGRSGEITSLYENVAIRRHTLGPNRLYNRIYIEWKADACQ